MKVWNELIGRNVLPGTLVLLSPGLPLHLISILCSFLNHMTTLRTHGGRYKLGASSKPLFCLCKRRILRVGPSPQQTPLPGDSADDRVLTCR